MASLGHNELISSSTQWLGVAEKLDITLTNVDLEMKYNLDISDVSMNHKNANQIDTNILQLRQIHHGWHLTFNNCTFVLFLLI